MKIFGTTKGFPDLRGRKIFAHYSEYTHAALELDGNEVVAFATEEEVGGTWFEVFPIVCSEPPTHEFSWTHLSSPICVESFHVLWREEWQEQAKSREGYLGSGPHSIQYTSPLGYAPKGANLVVRVLAGVYLGSPNGNLVICSSSGSPFELVFSTEAEKVNKILAEHTMEEFV